MEKLNFGCGKNIMKGWVNVDIQEGKGIDKSFDFNIFPYPFNSNTFSYVLADNILEHLNEPKKVLDELWRICKSDATIRILVPYHNCDGAYNDLDHKHFFNMKAMELLIHPERGYQFKSDNKFSIIKLDLLPTMLGKFIYSRELRNALSLIFNNVCGQVEAVLKVKK
jgi:predicted SAM-dependent methyltransferase